MKKVKEIPEFCENCSALMKEWWHTLTPGLVNILIKAIKQVKATNKNHFHATRDLGLTHNEAANFQKLRFHGLVAHADKDEKRSGYWVLTGRAGQFLRGEIAVPVKVKTYRNEVKDHSTNLTKISDFRGKISWFEENFDFEIHEGKVAPAPIKPIPVGSISFTTLAQGHWLVFGTDNKKYHVTNSTAYDWRCECEAFRFSNSKNCKHVDAIKKYLLGLQKEEAAKLQGKLL